MQIKRRFVVAVVSACALAAQAASQGSTRRLVERQARAWENQDFTLAAADWLPTAVLLP